MAKGSAIGSLRLVVVLAVAWCAACALFVGYHTTRRLPDAVIGWGPGTRRAELKVVQRSPLGDVTLREGRYDGLQVLDDFVNWQSATAGLTSFEAGSQSVDGGTAAAGGAAFSLGSVSEMSRATQVFAYDAFIPALATRWLLLPTLHAEVIAPNAQLREDRRSLVRAGRYVPVQADRGCDELVRTSPPEEQLAFRTWRWLSVGRFQVLIVEVSERGSNLSLRYACERALRRLDRWSSRAPSAGGGE